MTTTLLRLGFGFVVCFDGVEWFFDCWNVAVRNLGEVGVGAANRGRVRLPSDSVVFVII